MTKPLLSVITGTWQRLDYLRAMIDSVRRQIPAGVSCEFVVCDGGSTDGTLAWCKQQADVVLIEHSELRGALRAFTDAGRAARGDYTLITNDDVLFHAGSVIPALAHLEAHPECGGVAFADNRPAPGYGDGYKVQTMPVYVDSAVRDMPYMQVGMVRTALADALGWWGADDPIMSQGSTYGGDNWLSAQIYEHGFTIAALPACRVDDRIPADALREANNAKEQRNPGVYYRAFPQPPRFGAHAAPVETPDERLRILYLPLFSPGYGVYKRGLRDALGRVGVVYELDYLQFPQQIVAAAAAWQPHLILTQVHDGQGMKPGVLAEARAYAPHAVAVNWCGDVYTKNLVDPSMLAFLRHIDLQLVVNADVLPFYAAEGVQAAYWQVAFEPVPDKLPRQPAHDILFMANAYHPSRRTLGGVLRELSPNVGLYGWGWAPPAGNTLYDFTAGAALYRNCKIAIGDNMYTESAFVSNRLFEALANGAFLLHQRIPDLERYTGLHADVHYVEWTDYDDLRAKAKQYLADDAARRRIAAAGEAFVRQQHSFDARVRELFDKLLPAVAKVSADGTP